MQLSHSPILGLSHSVNSSPELRGASRSHRWNDRQAPSSRSVAMAQFCCSAAGDAGPKDRKFSERRSAARVGNDTPGGRNIGYSMVNLLIFTTFLGQ